MDVQTGIETNYSGQATVLKCFDENIVLTQSIVFNPVSVSTISKTTDGGETWAEITISEITGEMILNLFQEMHQKYFLRIPTHFILVLIREVTGQTIFVDTIDIGCKRYSIHR